MDDEEVGGEWITPENLYKHMSHGNVVEARTAELDGDGDGEGDDQDGVEEEKD